MRDALIDLLTDDEMREMCEGHQADGPVMLVPLGEKGERCMDAIREALRLADDDGEAAV